MNIFVEKVSAPFFSMTLEELALVEEKIKEAKKIVRKRVQEKKKEEKELILKELKEEAKNYRLAKQEAEKQYKEMLHLQMKEDEKLLRVLCEETFRGNVKLGDFITFRLYGEEFKSAIKRVLPNTVEVFVPYHGKRYVPYSAILSK